eukprot:318628_1
MWRRCCSQLRYQCRYKIPSFSRPKYSRSGWQRSSRFEMKYYPILALILPIFTKNEQGEFVNVEIPGQYIYGPFVTLLSIIGSVTTYKYNLPNRAQIDVKSYGQQYVTLNIKNDGNITGHKLEYAQVTDENENVEWKIIEKITNKPNVDCTIDQLKSNTNYMIRVTSMNRIGYGTQSKVIRIKTKEEIGEPDPPRIAVKSYGNTYINLNIKNNDIIGHKLEYVELDNNNDNAENLRWKRIEIGGVEQTEYNMESLKLNTNYLIRAASTNGAGYGSNSEILRVKTRFDTWGKEDINFGDYINIVDDNKAVFAAYKQGSQTVCSNNIVHANECYEWTLRINKSNTTTNESNELNVQYMAVAVIPLSKKKKTLESCFIYRGDLGYLYLPTNEQYPKAKFVTCGDVLKLKLDLKKMEIRLNINGVDHGIVPGVILEKTDYRLWVSIVNDGKEPFEIELL